MREEGETVAMVDTMRNTQAQETAEQGVRRPIEFTARGWHVQWPDGRWRLVRQVDVDRALGWVYVTFEDAHWRPERYVPGTEAVTRSPGEQILAVCAQDRRRHLATPRALRWRA